MPVPKFRVRIQDQRDIGWEQHNFCFFGGFFILCFYSGLPIDKRHKLGKVFPNIAPAFFLNLNLSKGKKRSPEHLIENILLTLLY